MKVEIKANMSGLRNGAPWPAPGEQCDLPDWEAASMIANGQAVEIERTNRRAAKKETAAGGKATETAVD